MTRRSSILAADSDRDRIAEQLRQAAVDGRIFAHELEERLARALRARTYGELDELVADLPRDSKPSRRRSRAARVASSYPAVAVLAMVAMTLLMLVAAAVVMAGMFAFSGVWVVALLVVLARHGHVHDCHHGHIRLSGAHHGYPPHSGGAYAGRRRSGPGWIR